MPPWQKDGAALPALTLCDAGVSSKLGIKGPDAEGFLATCEIDLPDQIYGARRLPDEGLIVRLGKDEFILESGRADKTVPEVASRLPSAAGRVFHVERQDATLLLIGAQAIDVLAQTCGVDFSDSKERHLVLTRIAGVSCGIMPESIADRPAFRIWADYTYTIYLWDALAQICHDLGGHIVPATDIDSELA